MKFWCITLKKILDVEDWWSYCPGCGYSLYNASSHKEEHSPFFMKTQDEIWKIQLEKKLGIMKRRVKKAIGNDEDVKIINDSFGDIIVLPNEYREFLKSKRNERRSLYFSDRA